MWLPACTNTVLSFWDFAAAGPYVKIEMNMADDQEDGHMVYKDAILFRLTSSLGARNARLTHRQKAFVSKQSTGHPAAVRWREPRRAPLPGRYRTPRRGEPPPLSKHSCRYGFPVERSGWGGCNSEYEHRFIRKAISVGKTTTTLWCSAIPMHGDCPLCRSW